MSIGLVPGLASAEGWIREFAFYGIIAPSLNVFTS